MLDMLILLSALTTIILVGIRFGFLEILAIILAVVALVPIAVSVYSYFSKRPQITYQVANKAVQMDGEEYLYQCMIGFSTKRGAVIVKDFFLSPEWDIIPERGPNSTAPIEYMHMLEETGFNATARFRGDDQPTYQKSGRIYVVQFRAKQKKSQFKVRMVLDTEIDPMKQGIFSVFHGLFSYRMFAEANMDFDNLNRQEGEFKSFYF